MPSSRQPPSIPLIFTKICGLTFSELRVKDEDEWLFLIPKPKARVRGWRLGCGSPSLRDLEGGVWGTGKCVSPGGIGPPSSGVQDDFSSDTAGLWAPADRALAASHFAPGARPGRCHSNGLDAQTLGRRRRRTRPSPAPEGWGGGGPEPNGTAPSPDAGGGGGCFQAW